MDLYLTEPVPPFPSSIGAAFATFTTRQDITGVGRLPVIPAGKLRAGSQLEVDVRGEFSTTGTPTLAIGIYLGTQVPAITTVIAESAAITTGSGAAAWPWELHWEGLVTDAVAAGSMTGTGYLMLGTSLTAYAAAVPIPTTAAARVVAIDTTIARAIGVCATWGTSSASNSIKVYKHSVSIRN
jgi:hypothetical protein